MDSFIPRDALIFSRIILKDTSVSYTEQSNEFSVDMLSTHFKCLTVALNAIFQ